MTQPVEQELAFGIVIDHDEQGRLITMVEPICPDDESPGAGLMLMIDLDHPHSAEHWAQIAAMLDPRVIDEVGAAMAAKVQAVMEGMTPEEVADTTAAVNEQMRRQGVEPPDPEAWGAERDA